ncbi:hypothetical protein QBC43DRAFT_289300 [Cladorrhinum sp. PSN259]|nr:hypothetical protein QBC43DRAFT_289300 [Cladorrhinum sp. PSN259]
MAAAIAANVVSVVGTVLGIVGFGLDHFAGRDGNNCMLRVRTGLNSNSGLINAEGGISKVRIFNQNQEQIGNAGGTFVSNGGFPDIKIGQKSQQQPAFVQIEATTNDGICIPELTTTAIIGYVGNTQPRCIWVDHDHTNGVKAGMIMVHWPIFKKNSPPANRTPKSVCGYPGFRAYSNYGEREVTQYKRDGTPIDNTTVITDANGKRWIEIEYPNDVAPTDLQIRGNRGTDNNNKNKVHRKKDNRLIVSNSAAHRATELCESETSLGPDFVSLAEGLYCNMENSDIPPLCKAAGQTDCFQLEGKAHVKRDGATVEKGYDVVLEWK